MPTVSCILLLLNRCPEPAGNHVAYSSVCHRKPFRQFPFIQSSFRKQPPYFHNSITRKFCPVVTLPPYAIIRHLFDGARHMPQSDSPDNPGDIHLVSAELFRQPTLRYTALAVQVSDASNFLVAKYRERVLNSPAHRFGVDTRTVPVPRGHSPARNSICRIVECRSPIKMSWVAAWWVVAGMANHQRVRVCSSGQVVRYTVSKKGSAINAKLSVPTAIFGGCPWPAIILAGHGDILPETIDVVAKKRNWSTINGIHTTSPVGRRGEGRVWRANTTFGSPCIIPQEQVM